MEVTLNSGVSSQSFRSIQTQTQVSPNVVFISIDDLNDWIGVLDGYVDVQTPNIDRLAAQGMVFENAHTPIPVCNAARTATFTGLQPDTTGIFKNTQDWRDVIPKGDTIPEYFQQNGYRSVGAGKLFHYSKPSAFDQFFDTSDVKIPKHRQGRFGSAALDVSLEDYRDVQIAEFASGYLSQSDPESPFFLGVGFNRPHLPLTAPQEFFDLYPLDQIQLPNLEATNDLDDIPWIGQQLAGQFHQSIVESGDWAEIVQAYLANISFMDAQVGKVLDAIESNGLADNTVIALWSDHGWHLGEKLHWQKRTLWEEATRVPLIISAPGVTEPGSSTDAPVSLVDLFPTLIDVTGISPKTNLEGHSLIPLLNNPQAEWDHAVISTWDNSYAVRTRRWRYIRYWDGSEELYDHQNDPNEFNNLASEPSFNDIRRTLSNQLNDYFAEYAPGRLPIQGTDQVLDGNGENDVITGGDHNDTLRGQAGDDVLFGGGGSNELTGDAGDDFLAHVSEQPGLLFGNTGQDTLVAGAGDDTLDGGIGDDVLEGRGGRDVYIVNSIGDRIIDSETNRGDAVVASVNWKLQPFLSRLTLEGAAETGKGNDENNRIVGNFKNNIILGDAGKDRLLGKMGDDSLVGGLGSDRLLGGQGNDTLDGSDGIDLVRAVNDADFRLTNQSLVGEGNDVLIDIEAANISGGVSDNVLDASSFSAGSVKLRGRAGNDTLIGGMKDDTLEGGAGVDTIIVRATGKIIKLSDSQAQDNAIDHLKSIENAVLVGHTGDSVVDASRFKGTTWIEGQSGNDILIPSQHASQLVGDEGADTFNLRRRNGAGIKIMDFNSEEGDVIAIENSILGHEFKAGQQISDRQFGIGRQWENPQQRFLFNPEEQVLWFDIDGLGGRSANLLAKIQTTATLNTSDLRLT